MVTYLMAGHHNHKAGTQYTYVDESVEQIPRSGANAIGYLLEAYVGTIFLVVIKNLLA